MECTANPDGETQTCEIVVTGPPVFVVGLIIITETHNAIYRGYRNTRDLILSIPDIFKHEEKPYEGETPDDKPEDFQNLGPSTGKKSKPKKKKSDGSVWEKDVGTPHSGSKWKRWPNERDYNNDRGREDVREDGSVR